MKLSREFTTHKYFQGVVNTCEYIMLHHTGKGKGRDIAEYLANNPKKVSCHYVVDIDGTIYQLADDKKATWHADPSRYQGKKVMNPYSIGIEIVSDGHTFTDHQREVVRELLKNLMKTHNIPSTKIIRHKDSAGYRGKRDVGDNFRNNQFSTFAEYQRSFDQKEEPKLTPEAEEARKLGIWNGLDPDKPATREQVAMMIMRAIKKLSE